MTLSATYSPDDNKLRLYASERLDADLYARVKEAGFSWAPKQGLFVAPAWTPGREDFLIELAGEIEDEDRTLVDRAEQRADRFGGYHANRVRDAEGAERGVRPILDAIPLGQPILVGHHSEKRARKDAERIESALRRAVTMWDRAEYWTDRAAGALAHAKHHERPDVRHRRVKGLEADRRKKAKELDEARAKLRLWEEVGTREQALAAANTTGYMSAKFPLDRYPRPEGASTYEGSMSVWSALKEGIVGAEEARRLALRCYGGAIEWASRWLGHYENRLAYERAMLAEVGGIKADAFDIQPGGQVQAGGTWLVVKRLNRQGGEVVSVSTMARDYRRVVGIEEVQGYRPPTEELANAVAKATKLAPLANYPQEGAVEMTKAEWDGTYTDSKGTRTAAATEANAAHRYRVVYRGARGPYPVFLTDAKRVDPPKAEGASQV